VCRTPLTIVRRADTKLVQSPVLAGRVVAELLNRKCSMTASLSMATALDMRQLGLVRLDRGAADETEATALQRKGHLRQVMFAERMAQYGSRAHFFSLSLSAHARARWGGGVDRGRTEGAAWQATAHPHKRWGAGGVRRSLAEALELHWGIVSRHLFDDKNRDGLWVALEMLWSLILANIFAAMHTDRADVVGHWLRGLPAVFSGPLDTTGEAFHVLLCLSAASPRNEVRSLTFFSSPSASADPADSHATA